MFVSPQPEAGRRWLIWGSIAVAVTVAVYYPVVNHPFLEWDDQPNVTQNPFVRTPSWAGVARFWRAPYAGMYVPLTYSWFAAEAYLSSIIWPASAPNALDARLFHACNLLLHVLCVLLVFRLLYRLVGSASAAGIGALFFSLHPLHVESVAWVTEAKGLLSSIFSLVAIGAYLRYVHPNGCADRGTSEDDPTLHASPEGEKGISAQRDAWWPAILGTAALVLAMLAKPSAAAVPLMAAALDYGLFRQRARDGIWLLACWGALAAVAMLVTKWLQGNEALGFVPHVGQRLLVSGDALAFYLYKLVMPFNLATVYGRTPAAVLASNWSLVAWLVPCVTVALLAMLPGRRVWLTAAAVFVAALAPVLGLVPFVYQDTSTVADRYVYLSLLGPSLAVAWTLRASDLRHKAGGLPLVRSPSGGAHSEGSLRRRDRSKAAIALCIGVLLVLGTASARQVALWRDELTLFAHAEEISPTSPVVHNHLGAILLARGQFADATSHLRRALTLEPKLVRAHVNLGIVSLRQDKPADAIAHLKTAIRLNPKRVEAHRLLGVTLAGLGRWDDAARHLREALQIEPHQADVHRFLGAVYARQGRPREAAVEYQKARSAASRAPSQ